MYFGSKSSRRFLRVYHVCSSWKNFGWVATKFQISRFVEHHHVCLLRLPLIYFPFIFAVSESRVPCEPSKAELSEQSPHFNWFWPSLLHSTHRAVLVSQWHHQDRWSRHIGAIPMTEDCCCRQYLYQIGFEASFCCGRHLMSGEAESIGFEQ
jgi:hypothetical protein